MNQIKFFKIIFLIIINVSIPYDIKNIYSKGLEYIIEENGSLNNDSSIKVGDYFLEIPKSISRKDAEQIVTKMPYFVHIVISRGINEQFNINEQFGFGNMVFMPNGESKFDRIKKNNEEKINKEINKSEMYKIINKDGVYEFIIRAIILELKSVLYKREKSLFEKIKDIFRLNNIFKDIKLFADEINYNKLYYLNEIDLIIEEKFDVNKKIIYLLSAAAYYVKNDKELFMRKNKFYQGMVNAISVPFLQKLENIDPDYTMNYIDYDVQKSMRNIYQKILKIFDIAVDGLLEYRIDSFWEVKKKNNLIKILSDIGASIFAITLGFGIGSIVGLQGGLIFGSAIGSKTFLIEQLKREEDQMEIEKNIKREGYISGQKAIITDQSAKIFELKKRLDDALSDFRTARNISCRFENSAAYFEEENKRLQAENEHLKKNRGYK